MSETQEVDLAEVVKLGAVDDNLFEKTFFPRTFRQDPPPYGQQVGDVLNGPARLVNIQIFRGGFKTTKLRGFMAKRVAYGLSRTILVVGKSEGHALRTSRWLRLQVERNRLWRETFGLRKGTKWQDHEFEISHGSLSTQDERFVINVVALGINGSTRGVNIDDYRPDLIILDDIMSDENAATPDARKKIEQSVYGSLLPSLAPASESPDAKLVSLVTPQNQDDYSMQALKDSQWKSLVVSCFTPEGESSWPARWGKEVLLAEKQAYIGRNKLSTWLREYECKISAPEDATFLPHWLKRWEVVPQYMPHVLCIDPVPPPSPSAIAKGLRGNDNEAFSVVGAWAGNFYLREILSNKGHDPSWSQWAFFHLATRYNVRAIWVEAIAYQRVLKWILQLKMQQERRWFPIFELETSRIPKSMRIEQGLQGPSSNGVFLIPPDSSPEGPTNSPAMQRFVEQYLAYPNVLHDDELEATANAVAVLNGTAAMSFPAGVEIDEGEDYRPNARAIPGLTKAP